ncbi:MAG: carbamoyltransferase HypF [Bacteroidales bacterium]|nr:carbamoyltransferase HypF [Bacteroidales bacterium]MBN2818983.1 carbamoyltransferase HypF [Bacteroidales bacterium]
MPKTNENILTTVLELTGLIQGVGFRPFIYKLAKLHRLTGEVYNQNNGVIIHLQGWNADIESFITELPLKAPESSQIISFKRSEIWKPVYTDFSIVESVSIDDSVTLISPDIAVCEGCIRDMNEQEHRIDYPFTNCTNCGPRFSIIESLPYDRQNTSMKDFEMCPVCAAEYKNITDRRFHAQPVACNNCGPSYSLILNGETNEKLHKILLALNKALSESQVIAMKGLGGFHLACNPFDEKALKKLREIKLRDSKPFALMVKDIATAKKYVELNEAEEVLLSSLACPVLLIKQKLSNKFPSDINRGLKTLGIFLPYLPFHHQLFKNIKHDILVMTSANFSDCPIIISNEQAVKIFKKHQIPILLHNRNILNRVDDSVVQLSPKGMQIIRRARGYVPIPVLLNFEVEGIFAAGPELSNAFCMGKGKQAILSQYIGDLKNFETMQFYEESYARFKNLFRFSPKAIACDMHPDYLSGNFARKLGGTIIQVQHHHAHIAACMAEHGLDEPVIGIAYDGTGYGDDNKIWGSEIMVADLENYERKVHFQYVPVPGGDKVSYEPWRSAVAYISEAFSEGTPFGLPFLRLIGKNKLKMVLEGIEKKVKMPLSCSAGRLFDAVSAILGICTHATYHAEAPILLENIAAEHVNDFYSIEFEDVVSWSPVIRQIVQDLIESKIPVSVIAAKFHNTVVQVVFRSVLKLHHETGIKKVVLSGGTFQNKYLTKKIVDLMENNGFTTYLPQLIPCNDGGIALGQLVVAAKQLEKCV